MILAFACGELWCFGGRSLFTSAVHFRVIRPETSICLAELSQNFGFGLLLIATFLQRGFPYVIPRCLHFCSDESCSV